MPIKLYIIRSLTEKDDETGESLYWNNEDGWTLKIGATFFIDKKWNLPIGGEWETFSPVREIERKTHEN